MSEEQSTSGVDLVERPEIESPEFSLVPVTADNFKRAETDFYFGLFVSRGALGKFYHYRALPPVELRSVRPNRDTLYSQVVFDLDAGPVKITLPDAGGRFMSMLIIDEDHYAQATLYGAGVYRFARKDYDTRYILAAVRTLVDPNDPDDFRRVHALQDAIQISQPGGPGKWEPPDWDPVSQKKVRDHLKALGETLPDMNRAAGRKNEVDPVRHLIGTASGWGLNPVKDAIYLNVTPRDNDGRGVYRLSVPAEVPVDGFWSISVYDAEGFFVKNDLDAYTLNGITAKKDPDGGVTVQFGGRDGKIPNCLPIMPGWNYMVRLYRPKLSLLKGNWHFPAAQRVN
jgi:hypothetical protein